jgi:hypothetical protein
MNEPIAGENALPFRGARRVTSLMGAGALLIVACASASPPGTPVRMTDPPKEPAAADGPFVAIGELLFSGGGSAAYSADRIVGSTVNLTYAGQGRWTGLLDGRNAQLTAEAGRITGPNVNLHLFQEGNQITLRGTWFQRSVSLTVSDKVLRGRTASGGPSYDFTRQSPGVWAGSTVGGRAGVEARGEAQQFPAVHMPQFALALLAALP